MKPFNCVQPIATFVYKEIYLEYNYKEAIH